ncbi:putative E3 ubiquitin-protein ligase MARCH [Dioscorea sansibarensis]
MGDHFVLLVDRLLTEQTLEAAIQSRNQAKMEPSSMPLSDSEAEFNPQKKKKEKDENGDEGFSTGKLVECRICQDEDEDSNMETPCSCCGSLKYAHRKCVQRWCNEKGDTVCEICLQQFKPGYTAPPQLFHYGGIPMNFRGNWEVSRRDINNHRFITMVPTDRDLVDSDYDDYSVSTTRNMMYCRTVAIVFMVLLVLRHTLPIILTGVEQYSLTLFTLLLLRTAGIVLPLYVMLKAVTTFHRRRNQQVAQAPEIPSSNEAITRTQTSQTMPAEMHMIHVQ